MSRPIKFRGKRKDNGEWAYGYYWCNEEAGNFHKGRHFIRSMNFQPAEFDYTDYEVIPETVGQFTGLKDKNGKEIYSGDIFTCSMEGVKQEHPLTIKDLRSFYLSLDTIDRYFQVQEKSIEVIGNIHENGDLLNE